MQEKVIRQYAFIPKKIDPAHILTMTELDISVALSSTLVEWDDSRQPIAGLSERWEVIAGNKIQFTIREGLKWSNGDRVLAKEVCRSFERAKSKYFDELRSLFDVVKSIRCVDERTIEFETNVSVAESNILRKITEPMYGLVDTTDQGEISLKRSSGPFIVERSSESEIILKKNRNWFKFNDDVADRVELRQQPDASNLVEDFTKDPWVNYITTNSLISEELMQKYNSQKVEAWQRSYDKIFFLSASRKFLKEYDSEVLGSIGRAIQVELLLPHITGFTKTDQFFPRGYVLNDPGFNRKNTTEAPKLKRSLRILVPLIPSGIAVKETLPREIRRITGYEPTMIFVKPNEISVAKSKGDYDLIALSVAVDDPNYEGAMSFFFAGDAPLIQSGTGENDFVGRISKTKSLKSDADRVSEMRSIISKATSEGFVAPLFHFASLALGKGLDFTKVPKTKETIAFAKIRFK